MSTATRKGTRTCQYDGREGRCRNPVDYSGWCSKHLRRVERHGDPDIVRPGAWPPGTRRYDAQGYFRIKLPGHPLADSAGWVLEHRAILFNAIGPDKLSCDECGKPLDWTAPRTSPLHLHVDHRDGTRVNNGGANLRPVCIGCNTRSERRCHICGTSLVGRRSGAKVCGPACRRERSRLRRLSDRKAEFGYSDLTEYLARKRRTEKPGGHALPGDFSALAGNSAPTAGKRAKRASWRVEPSLCTCIAPLPTQRSSEPWRCERCGGEVPVEWAFEVPA